MLTTENDTLQYVMIQNNLGSAYEGLASVGDKEARLKSADAAYTEVLKYVTAENRPPLCKAATEAHARIAEELGGSAGESK